jgi:hypothetical protein
MRYPSRRSMIESSQSSWSHAGAVVTNFEHFDLLDPRRRGGRGRIGIALQQDWGRSGMSTILLIQGIEAAPAFRAGFTGSKPPQRDQGFESAFLQPRVTRTRAKRQIS